MCDGQGPAAASSEATRHGGTVTSSRLRLHCPESQEAPVRMFWPGWGLPVSDGTINQSPAGGTVTRASAAAARSESKRPAAAPSTAAAACQLECTQRPTAAASERSSRVTCSSESFKFCGHGPGPSLPVPRRGPPAPVSHWHGTICCGSGRGSRRPRGPPCSAFTR